MDELDAEFLKLQQELADVEKSLPPPPPPSSPPPPPPPPPENVVPLPETAPPTEAQVVVKAQASTRPAWQQEMFDRDRQEIAAAAAVRREADAITGAASSTPHSKQNDGPNGEWIWTGGRWEWKTYSLPTTASTGPASINSHAKQSTSTSKKRIVKRMAAGDVWTDETLSEWPEKDFRIFVGDLAPDATETELSDAFGRYKSFNMARVVRDKRSGNCRGYGFVSFATGEDMVAALREMNGKYVGSRPVKLKKSNWQKRSLTSDRRKELKLFRSIGK